MSSVRTSQLLRSAPYFPVADLEQSAAHYERVLGFHCEYSGGTPPQFAILSRDGLAIMLRVVPTPERIRPNEKQGGTWDAFFWVRDVRALHAELRASGADIVYGPIVQEAYQMEEGAGREDPADPAGHGWRAETPKGQLGRGPGRRRQRHALRRRLRRRGRPP